MCFYKCEIKIQLKIGEALSGCCNSLCKHSNGKLSFWNEMNSSNKKSMVLTAY